MGARARGSPSRVLEHNEQKRVGLKPGMPSCNGEDETADNDLLSGMIQRVVGAILN